MNEPASLDLELPPPPRAFILTLEMRAESVDKIIYQWRGNDNKTYSPGFENVALALDYLQTTGLRPYDKS